MIGKKYAFNKLIKLFMLAMQQVTERVTDKIRNSELDFIEKIGKESIYKELTYNSENYNQFLVDALNAVYSTIIVCMSFFYVWFISKEAFLIGGVIFVLAGCYVKVTTKELNGILDEKITDQTYHLKIFNQLLMGFKELKLNSIMSKSHYNHLQESIEKMNKTNLRANYYNIEHFYCSFNIVYFTFLGIIVFILPKISTANTEIILKVLILCIFSSGSVSNVFVYLPLFSELNQIVKRMYMLETSLDAEKNISASHSLIALDQFIHFNQIHIENLAYHYHDKNGSVLFTLGPVSFTINKGEIIFVTGGNGSGKSTLVKLIGGLYFPASGNIAIDGIPLTESDYKAYRTLFSIITSDFYLFKRLYGLDSIDENLIFKYLKTMKLDAKTGIANKEFTNIQLSTGQRKRLAMIVSLLHDRQVFILDEWAADQDVSFRKYYYETLLTELKRKGKTLIVVSHDDRFYHLADKVIKLEYGDSLETQCSASLHKTI